MDLIKSVYLGNLPFDANEDMIRNAIAQPAIVSKVLIARNGDGIFMGYAFVELTAETEVEAAVRKLHGAVLGKVAPREIHVEPGSNYPDLLEGIGS